MLMTKIKYDENNLRKEYQILRVKPLYYYLRISNHLFKNCNTVLGNLSCNCSQYLFVLCTSERGVNNKVVHLVLFSVFDFAYDLANMAMKDKLPAIYLKHAMYLEDEGKYADAEAKFIQAKKAREAVLM